MWFKENSFAGLNTDAWMFNYGVGIGSTQIPFGVRLAVGSVQVTDQDIPVVRNINASGIITAPTFIGNLTGTATTSINVIGGVGNLTSLQVSGITTLGITSSTNLTTQNINNSGIITSSTFIGNLTGTATTSVNVIGGIASVSTLTVSGISTLGVVTASDISSSGIVTATQLSTGSSGIGINTNTIFGPAVMIIDPANVGDNTGILRIKGDFYVDGTQTIINSNTVEVADLQIGIANTATSDVALDGAGIGIGSTSSRKTFIWEYSTSSLKSSENINLAANKTYKINGADVLSSTTLGSGVTSSSLTSVGSLGNLNVSGVTTSIGGFIGNLTGTATTSTNVVGGIGSLSTLTVSGISTLGVTSTTNLTSQNIIVTGITTLGTTSATNIVSSGIITAPSFTGNLTGTATTATNLSDAANITTGTINSARLSGFYNINVSYANTAGIATYATIAGYASTAGISTVAQGLTGTPDITVGIATASSFIGNLTGTATTSTNVIGRIASVTSLTVSGISTLGITSTTNLTAQNLNVSGITTVGFITASSIISSGIITASSFTGNLTGTATTSTNTVGGICSITSLTVSGISTLGITSTTNLTAQNLNVSGITTVGFITASSIISSGIITASSFTGNLTGTATTSTNVIGGIASVTSLSSSGISTLGTVRISSGIVTATSGIVTYYGDGTNLFARVGLQSSGTLIGSGATSINFVNVSSVQVSSGIATVTIPTTTRTTSYTVAYEGQTIFPCSYTIGYVEVFFNGSKLSPTQYNANDGANVILVEAASANDVIETIGYNGFLKLSASKTILTEVSSDGLTFYTGKSAVGIATTSPNWSIRRSLFSSAGIVTSTGIARNIAWSNRASGIYT